MPNGELSRPPSTGLTSRLSAISGNGFGSELQPASSASAPNAANASRGAGPPADAIRRHKARGAPLDRPSIPPDIAAIGPAAAVDACSNKHS